MYFPVALMGSEEGMNEVTLTEKWVEMSFFSRGLQVVWN